MNTNLPIFRLLLLLALATSAACFTGCASQQKEFDSPDQAVTALTHALRANDKGMLKDILGPGSADLISSGDSVDDKNAVGAFLRKFDAKHEFTPEKDGEVTLLVGNDGWPLPIPLVKEEKNGKWYFDTETGKDEIISRRIGRNELAAIQSCLAVADAQKEYAVQDWDGDGVLQYARKFFSDPGKKNGLYWQTAPGEKQSPLGPLAAAAAEQGYTRRDKPVDQPHPFHGYYFRMLESQGPDAPGGPLNYIIGGRMIGGFAIIAYPADYGNSGITTFIINQDGVVYQRDLGEETDAEVAKIQSFNPGPGWKKAE